ncbi:hypothetical protein [Shewanella halifaxensis]|uniref:hypothetical protein n=1 Tax=Shewanella halifaxensis TaxID=271098 RepID=UPI000D58F56F|nr:hypothetical protein [Shewanella halifaxensis]
MNLTIKHKIQLAVLIIIIVISTTLAGISTRQLTQDTEIAIADRFRLHAEAVSNNILGIRNSVSID